ncbi:MAG TPA: hypothetical protein VGW12_20135 [Pyrinomonadaceae bacterium]|nr:hypothetical protein [Pyrinomonadaceae bacterium]
MKAEFDKEIDSLLREGARRARAASGDRRAEPFAGAHLDADEQSAFAENALPAAARVAYASHLADCDDCRRSVTQLMLAAGTAAQLNARENVAVVHTEASTRITWRERLAALFAPRALRYAVPALALLLVSAVTYIVLTRKSEQETSIARRNTTEAQTARSTATQTEAHHASQNDNLAPSPTPGESGTLASNSNASAPNPNDSQSREEIAANTARSGTSQPVVVAPLNDSAADAPPPPVPSAGSGAVAAAPAMPEMALPQPTPAPITVDGGAVSEQEAKNKTGDSSAAMRKLEQRNSDVENRQYENRQQRERISGPRRNNEQVLNRRAPEANNASDRNDRRSGELAASTAASPRAAADRVQTREAERDKDEKRAKEDSEPAGGARAAKSVAETRSVAGRRFRRQGDAWVDTAYAAGQSYTVVRRNSEQFRALTADEPQLRRIADALGGDITVVWKGRAYRIK